MKLSSYSYALEDYKPTRCWPATSKVQSQQYKSVSTIHTAVFKSQPGPGSIVSPAGSQFQLNCSVSEGYYISWTLQSPGRAPLEISNATLGGLRKALMNQGITVRNLGSQMSEVVFSGQLQDRESIVVCVAVDANDILSRFSSEPVTIRIYGKENKVWFVADFAISMHGIQVFHHPPLILLLLRMGWVHSTSPGPSESKRGSQSILH